MARYLISRRKFLKTTLGAGAAAATASLGPFASSALGANAVLVPPGKRGIILFTVRDAITRDPLATDLPSGFKEVFEFLANVGYKQIEFAGYSQHVNAVGSEFGTGSGSTRNLGTSANDFAGPKFLRQLLDDYGLVPNGNHGQIPSTLNETTIAQFRTACEVAATIGQRFIGTGSDPTNSNQVEAWDAAADRWNQLGAIAAEYGLKLYTHNHDAAYSFLQDGPMVEVTVDRVTGAPLPAPQIVRGESGIRRLEYFLQKTDPSLVYLEMDIYWAHVAQHRHRWYYDWEGQRREAVFDPLALVAANTIRYPLFHAKDGRRTGEPPGVGSGYTFVPFGTGDIDYKTFFKLMGARGYHMPNYEQDNAPGGSANPGQSLAFAEISYENMAKLRG